ncbi:hypothetical protein ScPMuIL_008018 [Solemya velum]
MFLVSFVKLVLIISVIVFCIHYWLKRKSYLFDGDVIARIARKYVGKDPEYSFDRIKKDLRKAYPGHILQDVDTQWMFMNAGGWMGSMSILHASVTEYVLFFGTAIDTSGHSGRYWANVSDTILTGTFRQWSEGTLKTVHYNPGDTVVHVWGEVTAVQWSAGTWMVEYGKGFIPSTLGFALADTVFSTQDFVTMFYVIRVYTKCLLQEAGFYLSEWKSLIKDSL